jgi:hypothetical protein
VCPVQELTARRYITAVRDRPKTLVAPSKCDSVRGRIGYVGRCGTLRDVPWRSFPWMAPCENIRYEEERLRHIIPGECCSKDAWVFCTLLLTLVMLHYGMYSGSFAAISQPQVFVVVTRGSSSEMVAVPQARIQETNRETFLQQVVFVSKGRPSPSRRLSSAGGSSAISQRDNDLRCTIRFWKDG